MKISFFSITVLVCAHQLLLATTVKALSVDAQLLPGQSHTPSAPGSAAAVAAAGRDRGGSMALPDSTTPARGNAAAAAAIAEAQAQAAREAAAANAAAWAAQTHAQSKPPGLKKGTTKDHRSGLLDLPRANLDRRCLLHQEGTGQRKCCR
ncbi:MAG: hypothetical protein JOS17DRAFT_751340 [Linnemannia elongata]|nr:MAG: hypothetical protein JOS17DRAFT_751340 [Linnemannia elongata]